MFCNCVLHACLHTRPRENRVNLFLLPTKILVSRQKKPLTKSWFLYLNQIPNLRIRNTTSFLACSLLTSTRGKVRGLTNNGEVSSSSVNTRMSETCKRLISPSCFGLKCLASETHNFSRLVLNSELHCDRRA